MDYLKLFSIKSLKNSSLSTSLRMPSSLFGVRLSIKDEKIFRKLLEYYNAVVLVLGQQSVGYTRQSGYGEKNIQIDLEVGVHALLTMSDAGT